ncbi:hypothetical protein GCM10027162_48930 [Streptomyces incanus]
MFRSDGLDQSLTLFPPHPGQHEPVVPVEPGDMWRQDRRELPDDVRAVTRSYALRDPRTDAEGRTAEAGVDFVQHGVAPGAGEAAGPASHWAARAAAGDRVLPPGDEDLVPLRADETALPTAAAVLAPLPTGLRARA